MFCKYVIAATLAASFGRQTTISRVTADDGPQSKPTSATSEEPAPGTAEYVARALGKSVSLETVDASLEAVAKHLGEQAGVTIYLDANGLDAVGINPKETKVSVSLENLSLRSVLRIVFSKFELTHTYREGVLMITTPEAADEQIRTKAYDAVDLISQNEKTPPSPHERDSLVKLIRNTLAPTTWDEVGGPGSIRGYRDTIIVLQTGDVHEELDHFLAGLRKAKKLALQHRETAPPVASISLSADYGVSEEYERIEKALESIVSLDFEKTSLKDVAADLRKKHKVNVYFQKAALSAVGLGTNTPVTFSCKKVKLKQALNLLLREMELTFFVGDGVLVTTTETGCENDTSRAYPVLDLVDAVPPTKGLSGEERFYDYESLVELIRATVAPSTWDEVGGSGSIEILRAHGVLVISQVSHTHEETEHLFSELRKTAPQGSRIAKREKSERVRLAVYLMPKLTVSKNGDVARPDENRQVDNKRTDEISFESLSDSEVLDLITSLIEPESWTSREDDYANAAAGRVVIRHTESVHRQLPELAKRLGVTRFREMTPSNWGSGGFGGGY